MKRIWSFLKIDQPTRGFSSSLKFTKYDWKKIDFKSWHSKRQNINTCSIGKDTLSLTERTLSLTERTWYIDICEQEKLITFRGIQGHIYWQDVFHRDIFVEQKCLNWLISLQHKLNYSHLFSMYLPKIFLLMQGDF